MGKFKDLSGSKFGKLTVVCIDSRDKYGKIMYRCKCECGNEKVTLGSRLLNGSCKSCGCLNHEAKIRNGKLKGLSAKERRLYTIWKSMRDRCNNPLNKSYRDYGGRGIKVCSEWNEQVNGFINFYAWAKENGYSNDLTIDRIDNSGNYEPRNCRWVDWVTQANNRRKPKMVRNQYGLWNYRTEPPKEVE